MARILIADDHEVVRRGVRAILESRRGYQVVAEVADGEAAVAAAIAARPDVAVIDYSLPLLDGLGLTRRLREICPDIQIVVFTMHDSESLVRDVVKAGARGFLLKSGANKQLLDAVAAVLVGRPYISCTGGEDLTARLFRGASKRLSGELTTRERDVVCLIAEGKGNKEISRQLNVSVKTVETHRGAVIRKLGSPSAALIVRYAIRNRLIVA